VNIPQKKDKGKSREVINIDVEANGSGEISEDDGAGLYPPTNEDVTETRRIEDVRFGETTASLYLY
jgi:hypothetical protein